MASRSRLFSKIAKDVGSDGNLSAAALSPDVSFGATVYDSTGLLPYVGNDTGDQAYVKSTNRFYIWDSAGWYNVALINRAPTITSVLDSDGASSPFALAIDGTATTITITATDSDGDPLTYIATADADFNGLATVTGSGNEFTITPFSQDSATTTSGTITFKATDGVNISSSISTFTLNFLSPLWDETVLSIGTSSTNGLNNSSIVDKSVNNATVNTSGTVTQTAFHPYLNNWSLEFDGSGDEIKLTATSLMDFGADITYEFWVYNKGTGGINLATLGTGGSTLIYSMAINGDGTLYWRPGSGSWGWATTAYISTASINPGQWNHVAIQRSGSDLIMGINGVNQTFANATFGPAASGTLHLGSYFSDYNNTGSWANGYFSSVRISTVARYPGSTYTIPTEKFIVDNDTHLLIGQTNKFEDLSNNDLALNIIGNTKVSAFNPFGQESEYTSNVGLGSGYSPLNEHTVWSGGEHTSYTGDFTYSWWMYLEGEPTGYVGVISDPGVQTSAADFTLTDLGYGNRLGLNTLANSQYTDVYHLPLTKASLKNQWRHITLSRKSGLFRLYVDGVRTNTARQTSYVYDYTTISNNSGINLSEHIIGNFPGYIADYKLTLGVGYDTETINVPTNYINDSQAYRHITWDNAGIFDKTGNYALTLSGNTYTSTTQNKYATTSIYAAGTMTTDNSAGHFGTNNFTMEGWFYLNSVSVGYQPLFANYGTADQQGFGVLTETSNRFAFYFSNGSSWAYNNHTGTTPVANQWFHVALVRSGSTITMYVDGTNIGTVNIGINSIHDVTTGKFSLGYYPYFPGGARSLDGYIENFQVLKGVAKYTTNFTPPTQTQGRTYQAEL